MEKKLLERNFYFLKGPLIEAIQLYFEELRLKCTSDLEISERFFPDFFREQLRLHDKGTGAHHPRDQIAFDIKAVRCAVTFYLKGEDINTILQKNKEEQVFRNSRDLVERVINSHRLAQVKAASNFIAARNARLKDLLDVLELIDELSSTKAGMDVLSLPLDCDVRVENLKDLLANVEKWYAILEQELDPHYTLRLIGGDTEEPERKQARNFCMRFQTMIRNSKSQFIRWKDSQGSSAELERMISVTNEEITKFLACLLPSHPRCLPFESQLAIRSTADSLMQTQIKTANALRLHSGVSWLAKDGLSNLDEALKGMMYFGDLLAWLAASAMVNAKTEKSESQSCLELLNQVMYENRMGVSRARELIRTMQEAQIVPGTCHALKFLTVIRGLVEPLGRITEAQGALMGNLRLGERVEDPSFGTNLFVLLFLAQAREQLDAATTVLLGDLTFTLRQAYDLLSPASDECEVIEGSKHRLDARKKPIGKTTRISKRASISQSLMAPKENKVLEEGAVIPDEQSKMDKPGDKGQKLEELEACLPKLPIDVDTGLEAVDISSFRRCIESFVTMPLQDESSYTEGKQQYVPSFDVEAKKELLIENVLDYCERNKYSSRARKARNVIALLEKNNYCLQTLTGGSHQRWKHPLLSDQDPIIPSTKSGGDLVHCRTVKKLDDQLQMLKEIQEGSGASKSVQMVGRRAKAKGLASKGH